MTKQEQQVTDEYWMQEALKLAKEAEVMGEVPIGALILHNNQVIGKGYNQPIKMHDPTAHAEILALRQAAQHQHNYRLPNTTLYVTLEPCLMCLGAMLHARIERLVFGAFDLKVRGTELLGSLRISKGLTLNHNFDCYGGVLVDLCENTLKIFFEGKRNA